MHAGNKLRLSCTVAIGTLCIIINNHAMQLYTVICAYTSYHTDIVVICGKHYHENYV